MVKLSQTGPLNENSSRYSLSLHAVLTMCFSVPPYCYNSISYFFFLLISRYHTCYTVYTARNIHFTHSLILFFLFRFGFWMTKVSKPAFHDRMFGRPQHGPHLSLRSSGEELAVLWPPEPSRARRILVPSLPIHPPPVVKQLCEYMNNVQ